MVLIEIVVGWYGDVKSNYLDGNMMFECFGIESGTITKMRYLYFNHNLIKS